MGCQQYHNAVNMAPLCSCGPLWAGPLWAGPLWAGPLWAHLDPCGHPLGACGHPGALVGQADGRTDGRTDGRSVQARIDHPTILCICPYIYVYEYLYIYVCKRGSCEAGFPVFLWAPWALAGRALVGRTLVGHPGPCGPPLGVCGPPQTIGRLLGVMQRSTAIEEHALQGWLLTETQFR